MAKGGNAWRTAYLVTYEVTEAQDFGGLASALKAIDGVDIMHSVWIVRDPEWYSG